jgi:hypothetical protein
MNITLLTERNNLAKIRRSLAQKKMPSEFLHNELFIYKSNKCTSDIHNNTAFCLLPLVSGEIRKVYKTLYLRI